MAAIRISLYGDSMTEYLHRPPRALAQALANEAPGREFELFNYGIGATPRNCKNGQHSLRDV